MIGKFHYHRVTTEFTKSNHSSASFRISSKWYFLKIDVPYENWMCLLHTLIRWSKIFLLWKYI